MSSSYPSLILVPGSFGESSMYDPVIVPLRAKGYDIVVLDPPCYPRGYSSGAYQGKAPPGMHDDAKFVAEAIEKKSEEEGGKDVVVLAHSYGGIPATESIKGLTREERKEQGKPGGVVRIAYMTACVPRVGENLIQVIQGGAPSLEIGEDGWMRHTDLAATAALCFNDLSQEDGIAKAAQFGRHSAASFGDALTYNGYKDLPVSWMFCENDKCVVPDVQQTAIDVIEASWEGTERAGKKVDVEKVMCDHVPIFGKRDETEKWIEGVIVKGSQE